MNRIEELRQMRDDANANNPGEFEESAYWEGEREELAELESSIAASSAVPTDCVSNETNRG
jgi:hypothetical protein